VFVAVIGIVRSQLYSTTREATEEKMQKRKQENEKKKKKLKFEL
jgi:hypothetical protein